MNNDYFLRWNGYTWVPNDTHPSTGHIQRLQASLAAIHYQSGRGFQDTIEAIAILKSIHEECEAVMPSLRKDTHNEQKTD